MAIKSSCFFSDVKGNTVSLKKTHFTDSSSSINAATKMGRNWLIGNCQHLLSAIEVANGAFGLSF